MWECYSGGSDCLSSREDSLELHYKSFVPDYFVDIVLMISDCCLTIF